MGQGYLIDTSAVIKYLNGALPEAGLLFLDTQFKREIIISFVTEIELQCWNPPNPKDLEIYRLFVSQSIVIGIEKQIISETIRIRKSFRLKLPDALIAATAMINDMQLIADNDKDFGKIDGLNYLNPMQML